MKRAIRALLICGAILAAVDGLVTFIMSCVFFSSASTVMNGGDAGFGEMTATSISSVAIVLLIISICSFGALVLSVVTLSRPKFILYVITLVLFVLGSFVPPGIIGCILAILLAKGKIIEKEQSN